MFWLIFILMLVGFGYGLAMYGYGKWCYRKWLAEVKAHAGTVENYTKCANQRNEYRAIAKWYEARYHCSPQVGKDTILESEIIE